MKGFKDTTKACYTKGGPPGVKGAARESQAMREWLASGERETAKPPPRGKRTT